MDLVRPERTPAWHLCVAAHGENVQEVRELLASGVDPNERAPPRMSALCGACYRGNLEIIEILLAAGADIDSDDGPRSTPALFYLVQSPRWEILGRKGLAATKDLLAAAKRLIGAGANVHRTDAAMLTDPLRLFEAALQYGRRQLLPLLLRAGAALVTTRIERREHTPAFKSCWALVDKVRKAKGFDEYAKHHARLITNVIAKCFAPDALPQEIYAIVATFVTPRGGG